MQRGRMRAHSRPWSSAILVGALFLAIPPAAAAPTGTPSPFIDPLLEAALATGHPQLAILVFESGTSDLESRLARFHQPFRLYPHLSMAAIVVTPGQFVSLRNEPGLLVAYRNEHAAPYLDEAAEYVEARSVWTKYSARGDGTTILVVDTGVDGTHPDVRYGENLVDNVLTVNVDVLPTDILPKDVRVGVPATDTNGHGTHVASIAGGTALGGVLGQDRGKYYGFANEADLIGFQAGIVNPEKDRVDFQSTTVLEAFNYALENRERRGILVVSNSWGTNGDFDPNSPINIATLQMYKAGLIVVFASGNEGADGPHTLNKYSVAPWVLGVGAGDYLRQVAKFSSRGTDPEESGQPFDHPDLVAPGVGITAAKGALNICLDCEVNPSAGYSTKSGSSMAAPAVSGIAAMILGEFPDLSPDQVMDALVSTATPMPQYDVWEAGAGYVNAARAFELAQRVPGERAEFLAGHVKYAGRESGDKENAKDPVSVGYGRGAPTQLTPGDQSVEEFAQQLFSPSSGLLFLVGALALGLLAFSTRRPGG